MKSRSFLTLTLGLPLTAVFFAGCATSAPEKTPTPVPVAVSTTKEVVVVTTPASPAISVPMAGKWKLDVARSSPIRPWDNQAVEISATSDSVTVTRHLDWGATRKVRDAMTIRTDGHTVTTIPVSYWLDTWYTNVYIGGDHQKRVTGEWLDDGRVLKLETNLKLEAQQGDHPVHIYDEYRLSADGRTLKLYELRSSRDEAMVYLFTRA